MRKSTPSDPPVTSPFPDDLPAHLAELVTRLLALVAEFLKSELTPSATLAFEREVLRLLRDMGHAIVRDAFNRAEPAAEVCPSRVAFGDETYRRRNKTPNTVGTLFGRIVLSRCVYECLEPGEPCVWPLETRLGIVAGLATPALAERVGRWSAEHEQDAVRGLLVAEHAVPWAVESLRKVTAAVRDGVAGPGETARIERVVELLAQAEELPGRHRPALVVGRDGVMVPIRAKGCKDHYQEASTGTVSVSGPRGQRLGTVYYGQMPESGQGRLSAQMITAVTAMLAACHALGGACPRLQYLSDGGSHQRGFFRGVLTRMADPWRPGRRLAWQWTLDFFHACTHLWTVAESLFGDSGPAWAWYRRMRHWLRHRDGGMADILRSATQHENLGRMRGGRREYGRAYRYLRRHASRMTYAANKRARLAIGSGVTEAACRTVFAQRLKRSGMTWGIDGGQVIVDLRVLVLSGVWERSFEEYVRTRPMPQSVSYQGPVRETPNIAA